MESKAPLDARTKLKQLAITEIQSRLEPHVVEELSLVLELCWNGDWAAFNVEELDELSRRHWDENSLRLSVVTQVVLDPGSAGGVPAMLTSCERFLRLPGPLQERILMARAQITNIPEWKIEHLPINHPFVRAAQLVRCFAENRSVVIDALVRALLIWTSATLPPIRAERSANRPALAEQRGAIVRSHIRSMKDFRDKAKATALFAALDKAEIPLPDRTVALKGGRKRRVPREGTWTELLKNRTWLKQLGLTLKRDLHQRYPPKERTRKPDKTSDE